MKKKIILRSIIIFVIGFIIYESYSIVEMFNKSNTIEEVNTQKVLSNNKSIAIMVQDAETEDWHEADNRDTWPSPTTHGFVGAECTDSDGAEIDYTNILKFDLNTYHATIDTKNSIYCTLYFAKGRPLLQALEETKGSSLNLTSAVDGMYRYKGTSSVVNNNYICFGTSDKTECLNKPDTYMYRIIGITSADDNTIGLKKDQLKLIKATPSSKEQKWASNVNDLSKWDESQAKIHVTSYYDENIKGVIPNGTYWDSIVIEHSWYNADQAKNPFNLTVEPITSQTAVSKVSLMYATDYYNAGPQDTTNWLYIKNGWSTNSSLSGNSLYDWTMSRYGYTNASLAWVVWSGGSLDPQHVDETRSVRPVFYLQSEINLTGAGKSNDPFRITTKNNAN